MLVIFQVNAMPLAMQCSEGGMLFYLNLWKY